MSLKQFESIALAYDGEPNGSSISFVTGVTRKKLALGVTPPRAIRRVNSMFHPLADADYGSDLVGVWLVGEASGARAYHIVHSDTREGSGSTVSRIEVSEAVKTDEGLLLPGAFAHYNIVLGQDGVATIGGLVLEPFVTFSAPYFSS